MEARMRLDWTSKLNIVSAFLSFGFICAVVIDAL